MAREHAKAFADVPESDLPDTQQDSVTRRGTGGGIQNSQSL